ncbi:MAG: hypothetical protein U0T77_12325 [Chitinophagales bacterium]
MQITVTISIQETQTPPKPLMKKLAEKIRQWIQSDEADKVYTHHN